MSIRPGAGPEKAISPFCRMWACSATAAATPMFCSTSRIVSPRWLRAQDGVDHVGDDGRRQPRRGLVHQQAARARHQRAADGQHLLLAAAQGAREVPPVRDELREQLEHLPDVGLDGRPVAPRRGAELEIVDHRHARPDLAPLRDLGHADAARSGRASCRRIRRRRAAPSRPRGRTSPISVLRSVVLPEPLPPSSATIDRAGTWKETSRSTSVMP